LQRKSSLPTPSILIPITFIPSASETPAASAITFASLPTNSEFTLPSGLNNASLNFVMSALSSKRTIPAFFSSAKKSFSSSSG
jgi:hypothetical protein